MIDKLLPGDKYKLQDSHKTYAWVNLVKEHRKLDYIFPSMEIDNFFHSHNSGKETTLKICWQPTGMKPLTHKNFFECKCPRTLKLYSPKLYSLAKNYSAYVTWHINYTILSAVGLLIVQGLTGPRQPLRYHKDLSHSSQYYMATVTTAWAQFWSHVPNMGFPGWPWISLNNLNKLLWGHWEKGLTAPWVSWRKGNIKMWKVNKIKNINWLNSPAFHLFFPRRVDECPIMLAGTAQQEHHTPFLQKDTAVLIHGQVTFYIWTYLASYVDRNAHNILRNSGVISVLKQLKRGDVSVFKIFGNTNSWSSISHENQMQWHWTVSTVLHEQRRLILDHPKRYVRTWWEGNNSIVRIYVADWITQVQYWHLQVESYVASESSVSQTSGSQTVGRDPVFGGSQNNLTYLTNLTLIFKRTFL